MVLENIFIQYKKPSQYIYWGENYVDIFRLSDTDKSFKKTHSINDFSLSTITTQQFHEVSRELLTEDTGIILNSAPFIFNIFEFEKLPFQERLKRDLVEWRVKKIFPENINEYEHDFFRLDKKRILSILLKKSLKENIEGLFLENGISLTYVGNSTVEIINHIASLKKEAPDFFIEIDQSLSIAVFRGQTAPYYIRKFRSDQADDVINEVKKTINFVKNSYKKVPRTCSFMVRRSDIEVNMVSDELSKLDIQPMVLKNNEQYIFPT
jgi:hypothetical protein